VECGGGGIDEIQISLSNCGRSKRFGFWKNGCITLIHDQKKVILYYNEGTHQIEVRYFNDSNNNVYNNKTGYDIRTFDLISFKNEIITNLINNDGSISDENIMNLTQRIINFINYDRGCDSLHCTMIKTLLEKMLPRNNRINNKWKKQQNDEVERAGKLVKSYKEQLERGMKKNLQNQRNQANRAKERKEEERQHLARVLIGLP